jgi:hypothetical protein
MTMTGVPARGRERVRRAQDSSRAVWLPQARACLRHADPVLVVTPCAYSAMIRSLTRPAGSGPYAR